MSSGTDLEEEWRAVPGYEGWYEVSNLGQVRRVMPGGGTFVGRLLKATLSKEGRRSFTLSKREARAGDRRSFAAAQLVAAAFIGPRPSGGHDINHKNGIRSDDRAANLEYVPRSLNYDHAVAHHLTPQGRRNGNARLTDAQVGEIRRLLGTKPVTHIAAQFGVTEMAVHRIKSGHGWGHLLDPATRPARVRKSTCYRGIRWLPSHGCWEVYLRLPNGRTGMFGRYRSEERAARKFDEVARTVYGDECVLNFACHLPPAG